MRVLQIEDDAGVAQLVELQLAGAGMQVWSTDQGEEGVDLAKVYDFDAVLLDGHLPDMSGLDVLRRLRAAKMDKPVMMVSGDGALEHKLAAFRAGVDDFLEKPFHRDELVARLQALIRRSHGHCGASIEVGPLHVDLDQKTVRVCGKPVHLTAKEYGIVEVLSLRKNVTLTKEAILENVYGGMDEPEVKIIDVFVCKIRKKFADRLDPGVVNPLETVWGRGYRMVDTPTAQAWKPKPTENYVRMGETSRRVLELVGETPVSMPQLLRDVGGQAQTLRASLSALMRAGKVKNIGGGPGRPARYVTAAAG